jgi:hypothetical protein
LATQRWIEIGIIEFGALFWLHMLRALAAILEESIVGVGCIVEVVRHDGNDRLLTSGLDQNLTVIDFLNSCC